MNLNISPEIEFDMMQQFFLNGGNSDNMPEELLRVKRIWKRADELVRKYPYYDNEKIANQLMSDLPEYNLALSTAKKHVTYAKKYFDQVEAETPATHRRILTDILYRQIAILERQQLVLPSKAHQISKVIESISNRISSLNHLYDQEKEQNENQGDIFLVLSNNDLDFPDIPSISEKELQKAIKKVTEEVDISPDEFEKIMQKDVKGNVI
jgi:hypothetical protein